MPIRLIQNLSNDVVFDSSAINRALDDDNLLRELIAVGSGRGMRILVPALAVQEIVAADDLAHIERRGSALRRIANAVPLRFVPHGVLLRQSEDGRELFSTPVWSREYARAQLPAFPGWSKGALTPEAHQRVKAHVQNLKRQMLLVDQYAQRRAQVQRLDAHAPDHLARVFQDMNEDWTPHLDWLVRRALRPARNGRIAWRLVLERPSRFKSAWVWAGTAFQTMFGTLFSATAGYPSAQRLRVTQGSWYDNDIASVSAYARILVTNDTSLLYKCGQLASRGFSCFTAMKLADFLSGPQSRPGT